MLLTLVVTVAINYVVPNKVAFLNFYYLPIILIAYYLGRRKAVLGSLLCILCIVFYVVLSPASFRGPTDQLSLYMHLVTWAGFLILAGAVVGDLQERLIAKVAETDQLNGDLASEHESLVAMQVALKEQNENLEERVYERTLELESSHRAIAALKVKVEDALYSTMDAAVVNLLIEGRLRNEKRDVSVLFSDLVGFTPYSEDLPPEVVIREINRYIGDIEPVLLAFHGHIDKYMGDGIMAEFGAPLDYDTHRLLAVLAAVRMQEKLASLAYPWKMRIGIASGSTITGMIGSKRQTYTAIGDVVNLAARLEPLCPPGGVLIDQHTADGVERYFELSLRLSAAPHDGPDPDLSLRLAALLERWQRATTDVALANDIARIYGELGEWRRAMQYLEAALQLDPTHAGTKIAFADTTMKLREEQGVKVKGKRQRVKVYEVVRLKDPLKDTARIPRPLEHPPELDRLGVPAELTLSVEGLDGSVGHAQIVSALSYAMACKLGLPDEVCRVVYRAASAADIGKEIVPHHILNRRGSLTTSEFELVKKHPEQSVQKLRQLGYDEPALLELVLLSHESPDGRGYPRGLCANDIPLPARVIPVADAYSALTSWRPYRDPWERHAALDEIQRCAATGMYDAQVTTALVDLVG